MEEEEDLEGEEDLAEVELEVEGISALVEEEPEEGEEI